MDCSTPGSSVLQYLQEFAQTHVRWVGDLTILSCPPFLLPSIFLRTRIFSKESALRIRWPKDWSFSFNTSPSILYLNSTYSSFLSPSNGNPLIYPQFNSPMKSHIIPYFPFVKSVWLCVHLSFPLECKFQANDRRTGQTWSHAASFLSAVFIILVSLVLKY